MSLFFSLKALKMDFFFFFGTNSGSKEVGRGQPAAGNSQKGKRKNSWPVLDHHKTKQSSRPDLSPKEHSMLGQGLRETQCMPERITQTGQNLKIYVLLAT